MFEGFGGKKQGTNGFETALGATKEAIVVGLEKRQMVQHENAQIFEKAALNDFCYPFETLATTET